MLSWHSVTSWTGMLTYLLIAVAAGQDEEQLAQLPAALRGEVVWRLAGPTLRASRLLGILPEEVR